jgi:hypothetical protein
MSIDLSAFTFIPDSSPDGVACPRGDGGVVVPFEAVPFGLFGDPPESISVVDRSGRSVVYTGGGPTYFVDTPAGTEEFAGWSYYEEEATEDLDGPCVNLFILHPDYPEASYLEAHGVA